MGFNGSQRALSAQRREISPRGGRNATGGRLGRLGGSGPRTDRTWEAKGRRLAKRAHPRSCAAFLAPAPRRAPRALGCPEWRSCRAASATGRRQRNGASRTGDSHAGWDGRKSGTCPASSRRVLPQPWQGYESSVSPILSQLKCIGNPSAVSIPTTSVNGSPTTLV